LKRIWSTKDQCIIGILMNLSTYASFLALYEFFACTKQHANKILVEYRLTNFGKIKNFGNPFFCLSDAKIIMGINSFQRMFAFFVFVWEGLPLSLIKDYDKFRIYLIQKTVILLYPFIDYMRIKIISLDLRSFVM